MKEGENDRLG